MPSNRPLQGTTSSLGHNCTQAERDRAAGVASENGKHGPTNPSQVAALEYAASTNISGPLAQQTESQVQKPPDENKKHAVQREMRQMKNRYLKEKRDEVNGSISGKTVRAVDFVTQSAGASSWLTVLPIRVMNFYLNKSKSRDAVKLRYDWEGHAGYVLCLCLL